MPYYRACDIKPFFDELLENTVTVLPAWGAPTGLHVVMRKRREFWNPSGYLLHTGVAG